MPVVSLFFFFYSLSLHDDFLELLTCLLNDAID